MQNRGRNNCIRRKAGFTLVETLLVVGIIIILLALSILLVSRHLADIRQEEMDSKAEVVYTAAQNRLAVLRANGNEHKYQARYGAAPLGYIPLDADETVVEESTLYYVSSANKKKTDTDLNTAADEVLPRGCVDFLLWDSNWIIEYSPESGDVYAVFYSEERDLEALLASGSLNSYRYQQTRRNNGGYVGYYGGDISLDEMVTQLNPFISVENGEKLVFTFQCTSPDAKQLLFDIEVSDGDNVYKLKDLKPVRKGKNIYQYVWCMDDLSTEAARFYNQCPGLNPGKNITVSLKARSENNLFIDAQTATPVTNNGLFGYEEGLDDDTALILCARHLQNLDSSFSKVHRSISKAVQKADISFAEDVFNDEDWYSLYGNMAFEPIDNPYLTAYNGSYQKDNTPAYTAIRNLTTTYARNSGLFASLYGGIYENITLTGITVTASENAGGLAGTVESDTILRNCRVYLDENAGDLKEKTKVWISGQNAGGLVGHVFRDRQLTVSSSFAATVAAGSFQAGGLVADAGGQVHISRSYADCYLTAPKVAGLVIASGLVTVEDCYAAGYITADGDAAGLVLGQADMKRSYSACYYEKATTIYTTAGSGSTADRVYYLQVGDTDLVELGVSKSYSELSNRAYMKTLLNDGSEVFTDETAGYYTHPYNLQGQALFYYSFPGLSELEHYGDWKADFEPGNLVYYEAYANGEYGFVATGVPALKQDADGKDVYVLGDGYGIVYDNPAAVPDEILVRLNDGPAVALDKSAVIQVQYDGKTYLVYPLDKAVLKQAKPASQKYYQKLTITGSGADRSFYFNPHFAMTVTAYQPGDEPSPRNTIYIRSARQLHLLSLYYPDYAQVTKDATFVQEMDICYQGNVDQEYQWNAYWGTGDVTHQEPIGDGEKGFIAKYNGGHKKIYNLNIDTESLYVGLFGRIAQGAEVSNVVLVADYNGKTGEGGEINHTGGISAPGELTFVGTLAGRNDGDITNCAVSGYVAALHVYNGSEVYQGGLVGGNYGNVHGCTAVGLNTSFNIDHSYVYGGGFAGVNYGIISQSYAIGALQVDACKNAYAHLSGFVGLNNMGTIQNSYCATALIGSGEVLTSAFTPKGGMVTDCYYLANGAYYMADTLYAFQSDENETEGAPLTDSNLENATLWDGIFQRVEDGHSFMHDNTAEPKYLYPAIVKNEKGAFVHYGDWPVAVDMGNTGMFYWEKEEGGSNAGIHFSYIGVSQSGVASDGSNLCTAHEDGGRITAYGYGYFYHADSAATPAVSMDGVTLRQLAQNTEVQDELHYQMPQYIFVAYTTGTADDQLKPVGANANLSCRVDGVEYAISPFFADAMACASWKAAENETPIYDLGATPGTAGNAYQIRSPQQLQFINWNYDLGRADYAITARNDAKTPYYTYLRYIMQNGNQSAETNGYNHYWVQSHDVDFDFRADQMSNTYTPIGSLYDNAGESEDAETTMAYFAGSYNGMDYTIENLQINTSAACVGLFGVAMRSRLENISIYSERSNIIQVSGGSVWYCVGGLVGFAGKGGSEDSVIRNCSVAGYRIIEKRANHGGWGGGNLGGLVGATNMDISNCAAVTDIILQFTHSEDQKNVRVGGLVGCVRSTISNCYAGGSIVSKVNHTGYNDPASNSSIWAGGISGGIVMRSKGNFSELVGDTLCKVIIENCYSYVQLPPVNQGRVVNVGSIATIGEMTNDVFQNYVDTTVAGNEHQQSMEIRNSYCLVDAVLNANDYITHGTRGDWTGAVDLEYLEMSNSVWWAGFQGVTMIRYTKMFNEGNSPYLTYGQMIDGTLLRLLNSYAEDNGLSSFDTITVQENGAPIPGKYTFPADADYLNGRDYPFPTILTQLDRYTVGAVDGKTVNVHYGRWPMIGMHWAQYETELDLFVHDETTARQAQQITLILNEDVLAADRSLQPEDFLYDGQAYDPDSSPVQVLAVSAPEQIKDEDSYLNGKYKVVVTLVPRKVGTVHLRPNRGSYKTNELYVKVTAELLITAVPGDVNQCINDKTWVTFIATNKDTENPKDMTDLVTWEILFPQMDQTVATDEDEDKADNKVLVVGQSLGSTFLQATASYMDGRVQASAKLLVGITVRNGVVGLSDNTQFNQAEVGNGGSGKDVPAQDKPVMSGMAVYLYADCDVSQFELVGVRVNGSALTADQFRLGQTNSDMTARELFIVSDAQETVDLEVTVKRADKLYTLSLKDVELKPSYSISFLDENGDQLTQLRVAYGGSLAAEQFPVPADRAGFRFLGWYDGDTRVESLTDVRNDRVLVAKWQATVTVRFEANGSVYHEAVLDVGAGLTLPADPVNTDDTKQRFAGWIIRGTNTKVDAGYRVTSDLVLEASWRRGRVAIVNYGNGRTAELEIVEENGKYVISGLDDYGKYTDMEVTADGRQLQKPSAWREGDYELGGTWSYWGNTLNWDGTLTLDETYADLQIVITFS